MLLIHLFSCAGQVPEPPVIESVAQTESWYITGLQCQAQVVRTEGDVPHIYAHNREDLARIMGFVAARDRYFEMDLARRLGLGEASGLLGQDALEIDKESRLSGMTWVSQQVLDNWTDEQLAWMDAYAEGVNAYIAAVEAGQLPPPSELELAGPFLGAEEPADLMEPWDRRSLSGLAGTVIYELGYETGDIGNAATEAILPTVYDPEAALSELRTQGAIDDIWNNITPLYPVASAPDWTGGSAGPPSSSQGASTAAPQVPLAMLERLDARTQRRQDLLGHNWTDGFGSNAWAVMGEHTPDGRALMAGDGHLALDIPGLFWQVGLDTELLGGGDTHQLGVTIPGMPHMAVGTNGDIAWSQTQLMGDVTDWYAEELQLDADGAPSGTLFQGTWEDVVAWEESIEVADVPVLGSEGRTETLTRYTTFDGRWITEIEGTVVDDDYSPQPGETVVDFGDHYIVPGDTDGDGVISALSFDYAGLDGANIIQALDHFGHAESVEDFRQATAGLVAYSQNFTVADSAGSVLYTGYQAVPCREYLPRNDDGTWADGADPHLLLDGTQYGGFTIPVDGDGRLIEGESDPSRCVVPLDEYPYSVDPAQGYVITANNDPAGLSFDNSLTNDGWYIGGPWSNGYRAHRIDVLLADAVANDWADMQGMATIQNDTRSSLGSEFGWALLEAIEMAQDLSATDGPKEDWEQRLVDLYDADAARMDQAHDLLQAWADADFPTPSGVETFYNTPAEGDADLAVATMIHNAWMSFYVSNLFDDEGLPGVWEPWGNHGRTRAIALILGGRGAANPAALSSWNPETEESAFFDVLGTEPIERSQEIALLALVDAFALLESPAEEDSRGGFGTADLSEWIWGYKHVVRFDSILASFVGDEFAFLSDPFNITTDTLPLVENMDRDDPRNELVGFPRPGDTDAVDAANNGFSTDNFDYGSGPVFRMIVAVDGDNTSVWNVIPGGQSGMTDSPYFSDQAALWLGNERLDIPFAAADVAAAGTGREVYHPVAPSGLCGF